MSLVETVLKLKTFITNGLKYSSVAIVVIIPLAVLLAYFGFVRDSIIQLITEIVLFFAVAEALFNALWKKYLKSKVEIAEVKAKIEVKNFEALAEYKKQDVQFSDATLESLASLMSSILSKKKVDTEVLAQAEEVVSNIEKDNSTVSEPVLLSEPLETKEFTR